MEGDASCEKWKRLGHRAERVGEDSTYRRELVIPMCAALPSIPGITSRLVDGLCAYFSRVFSSLESVGHASPLSQCSAQKRPFRRRNRRWPVCVAPLRRGLDGPSNDDVGLCWFVTIGLSQVGTVHTSIRA